MARRIDGGENYKKMNNKGGKPAIFNAKVMQDSSTEAVFVVEGIFDALSIIETGAAAIALNSSSSERYCLYLAQELWQPIRVAAVLSCWSRSISFPALLVLFKAKRAADKDERAFASDIKGAVKRLSAHKRGSDRRRRRK